MLTCFVSLMAYNMYFDLSDGCNLWPYCQTEWGGPSPPGSPCPRRPITWSPAWSGLEVPSWSTKQQMVDQVRNDIGNMPLMLWRSAILRGHGTGVMQRPSPAIRTWWWWW